MKHRKCYALGIALGIILLMPISAMALSIGNFIATGPTSGQVEISDINDATYLDVVVELDSKPVNYVIEQISDDQVLINVNDRSLDKRENLIEVSVSSDFGSKTRSFVYFNDTATPEIVNQQQAKDAYTASLLPTLKQLFVPAAAEVDDDDSGTEFKDGIFHIKITKGQTSVGTAVEHLARVNNLNVFILPGDRAVHDSLLVGPVGEFKDLYLASDKQVRHVFIDRARQMVRIVGNDSTTQATAFEINQRNTLPDKTTNLGQLLKDTAIKDGYTALIYPGDIEALLDTPVSWEGVRGIDDLAILVGKNGGRLDIDRTNRLLRARKL